MAEKYSINLLQSELIPDKPLLTLPRVLMLWLITLIVMAGITVSLGANETRLAKQANDILAQKQQQQTALDNLKNRLVAHKPSPELNAKLETLQAVIANKRSIYGYLTNSEQSYVTGFANAMKDLALIHSSDISVTRVQITDNQIRFGGVARSADAVPAWLNKFEQSTVLSGRLFNHFQLTESEDNYIEFTVSSSKPKEEK